MRCHPSHWLSYFSEGLKPPTSNVGYSSQKLRHQSRSTEKPHSHGSNQRRNTCWESCLGCGSWPFIPFTLLLAKAENEPGRHTATAFCTDKTTKGRVLPRPSSGCNLSNPLCHKPTITGMVYTTYFEVIQNGDDLGMVCAIGFPTWYRELWGTTFFKKQWFLAAGTSVGIWVSPMDSEGLAANPLIELQFSKKGGSRSPISLSNLSLFWGWGITTWILSA